MVGTGLQPRPTSALLPFFPHESRPLSASLPPSEPLAPETGAFSRGLPWDDPGWFRDLDTAEARCREYLEELRWPEGVTCPRCGSRETARLEARKRFWCRDCKHQFSVTSGTLFHGSHAPVWKWFLAVQLLVESEGGLPANQLVRQLGGSYKTAWFIEHRVRAALKESRRRSGAGFRPVAADAAAGAERVYDRSVVGVYHQHGVKHLEAYRAESEWLASNAHNPNRFRDTVLALLEGEPLSYDRLIRTPAGASSEPVSAGST
jgi:transposase-like protein